MPSIKISTTDKGEFHWERYLLQKQELRVNKVLHQLDVNPWKKRIVIQLLKLRVDKDNIIPLSQHPIKIFLNALITDDLESLMHHTSITKIKDNGKD